MTDEKAAHWTIDDDKLDRKIVLTPDGIDLETSDAQLMKKHKVFRDFDMYWVVVPSVDPPAKPTKPCRYCRVPCSKPLERGGELVVGTVITCTNCGAYWYLFKLSGHVDSMLGWEHTYWRMVVPEKDGDNEVTWVPVLYDHKRLLSGKVDRREHLLDSNR